MKIFNSSAVSLEGCRTPDLLSTVSTSQFTSCKLVFLIKISDCKPLPTIATILHNEIVQTFHRNCTDSTKCCNQNWRTKILPNLQEKLLKYHFLDTFCHNVKSTTLLRIFERLLKKPLCHLFGKHFFTYSNHQILPY